jgi:hypothetical protein
MVVVHLVAGLGFGVHECRAKGTSDVLFIERSGSCDEIHGSCSCGKESCRTGLGVHDNECCSTEIYHLDSEYSVAEDIIPEQVASGFSSLINFFVPEYRIIAGVSNLSAVSKSYIAARGGPFSWLTNNSLLSIISFWRL